MTTKIECPYRLEKEGCFSCLDPQLYQGDYNPSYGITITCEPKCYRLISRILKRLEDNGYVKLQPGEHISKDRSKNRVKENKDNYGTSTS